MKQLLSKILFGSAACFICASAGAQVSADSDSVTVLAGRFGTGMHLSARPLQLITANSLKNAPAQSLDDYLDYIPALDMRQRSGLGVQGDLSIRGGNYEQTLVMLDGVPLTDPQTGHHTLNLPVPMEWIGMVELNTGAAGRIFGPKAMAGSLNLVSLKPDRNRAFGQLAAGDFGFYRAGAGVQLNHKGWGAGLLGNTQGSSGYMTNTDFRSDIIGTQLYRGGKNGSVIINMSAMNRKFGAQNFYTASYPLQYEEVGSRMISAAGEQTKGNWSFRFNGYYRSHHDRFELFREGAGYYIKTGNRYIRGTDTAPSWYSGHNYHLTSAWGGMGSAGYKWKDHLISIGAEFRHEEVYSNVLGEPITPVDVPFASNDVVFNRFTQRDNISVYLEDQWTFKSWTFNGGAMLNVNSKFGNQVFPGLDVAYRYSRNMNLYAAVNTGNRCPTFTDLYYNRGGAVGSKNLKPEQALSYEAGLRYREKGFYAQAAVFVREGKNLIDWVRYTGSATTTAANLTGVTYYGAEANGTWKPAENSGVSGILSMLNFGGIWMDASKSSSGFESNYALDFLNWKAFLGISNPINKRIQLNWFVNWQQRKGGYVAPGSAKEIAFSDILTVDMKIRMNEGPLTVYAECSNLFNARVMDLGNVMLAGRWWRAGISVRPEWD